MKSKTYFIIAQLLGLFPAKSLWGSESFQDLQFRKLSLQMIYSWITILLRFFVQYTCNSVFRIFRLSSEPFDHAVATNTFYFCFCTGFLYQALVIYRTKRFIILLKNMENYDKAYQKAPRNKSGFIFTPFMVYNLIFLTTAIMWTITAVVFGSMAMAVVFRSDPKYQVLVVIYAHVWSMVLAIIGIVLVIILMETATLFPIIQLNFLVKAMEHRLEDIHRAVEVGTNASPGKLKRSPRKWADQTLYGKLAGLGQTDDIGRHGNKLWSFIVQRYVDYIKLFQTFSEFSGIYFVVLYPMQIVSAVFIIYMMTATAIFNEKPWMQNYTSFFVALNLLRIWGMCNLGNRLERVQASILEMALGMDGSKIGDLEEKRQFERFSKLVETLPVRLKASGYFTVRRGNIPGIIAAVVSYIIVLFQFKQAFISIGKPSGGQGGKYSGVDLGNQTNTTDSDSDFY